MSIKSECQEYKNMKLVWKKYRDVVEGEDKVKEMGDCYLPKLRGMDDDDFYNYINRAQFYNATSRTVNGLSGLLFRKKPIITIPDGLEQYLEDVDGMGHNIYQFIHYCSKDYLVTNWGGVLIESPKSGNNVSKKQAEELGLKPYLVFYKAEEILNWQWLDSKNNKGLQYVIFKEVKYITKENYETKKEVFYRVCEINKDNIYEQSLYNDSTLVDSVIPKTENKPFNQILFYFLSNESQPKKSVIHDIANVNLSHFKKSADYENTIHWGCLPTPYARGWTPDSKDEVRLDLGGSKFIFFPNGVEEVGYLEYDGGCCTEVANAMKCDEERMAVLGARIIAQKQKGVEAAETARIHNSAENSVLAEIANNLSDTFSKVLHKYLEWCTGTTIERDEVSVKINTDYDTGKMTPQEITALVELWQNGGIAKKDLFNNLKEGEIINSGRTFEEMQIEIEEEQIYKRVVDV